MRLIELLQKHPHLASHVYSGMQALLENRTYYDGSVAEEQCKLMRDAAKLDYETHEYLERMERTL